jgi:hypothetical protein
MAGRASVHLILRLGLLVVLGACREAERPWLSSPLTPTAVPPATVAVQASPSLMAAAPPARDRQAG